MLRSSDILKAVAIAKIWRWCFNSGGEIFCGAWDKEGRTGGDPSKFKQSRALPLASQSLLPHVYSRCLFSWSKKAFDPIRKSDHLVSVCSAPFVATRLAACSHLAFSLRYPQLNSETPRPFLGPRPQPDCRRPVRLRGRRKTSFECSTH